MVGEVVTTDEFEAWFATLDAEDQDAVTALGDLLCLKGLALGAPYSSSIKGTRYPFRELRSHRHRKPIRVIYAFSPERNAVLLIGGDKTGNPRFYAEIVRRAENIWKAYLRERAASVNLRKL